MDSLKMTSNAILQTIDLHRCWLSICLKLKKNE